LHVLKNRKEVLIGTILITLSVAFLANLIQKPVYRSSVELILQPKDSKIASSPEAVSSFLNDPTLLLTQLRLIEGPALAEKTLEELERPENRESLLKGFHVRPSGKPDRGLVFSDRERRALVHAIQGAVSGYQVEQGTRLIGISATGHNPQALTLVANAAAQAYVKMSYDSYMNSFQQGFLMMSQSLSRIREKIKTGEIALKKISSEIQLLETLKVYGEKYPLVLSLRSEIPELTKKLAEEVQNLETLEVSQRKDLTVLLTVPVTDLEGLLKIETELRSLKPILEQEISTNKEMYDSIFRRLQESEISVRGNDWMDPKVVEPATVPSRPIRPNKKLNLLLGLLLGIFLGTAFAFLQEYLDNSVRSPDDVRSYLKLFPLGMVPFVSPHLKEGGQTETFQLQNDADVPLYVAEAYRIIRTNLSLNSPDSPLKTVQITSAIRGEGKTTTAANLGISVASAGSRTLLVDADLRIPSLQTLLRMEGTEKSGLSDLITSPNGHSPDSLVFPTTIPNLFFLPAGTIVPNPTELLSSKRMKTILQELKSQFDLIIFDSPPVISVADSAIIASWVDGTILVSRAGFTPRHLCLHAKNALESVNAKLVGCVLNSTQMEHQPYGYHHYYREYGRYGGEKETPDPNGRRPLGSFTWERLRALREPFWVLLSANWQRLRDLVKRSLPKKESKTSVGSE
jgi:capsular exopolysaccharide synthesis family protein